MNCAHSQKDCNHDAGDSVFEPPLDERDHVRSSISDAERDPVRRGGARRFSVAARRPPRDKLKPFAVQPQPVRELELSAEPERLPWFAWLGLVPLLFLAAAALYLHAHWDDIPLRRPVHWGLDCQPNRWADRSFRGVYGPVIFGAAMSLWLFGFALAGVSTAIIVRSC